jgi:hypothetical protein
MDERTGNRGDRGARTGLKHSSVAMESASTSVSMVLENGRVRKISAGHDDAKLSTTAEGFCTCNALAQWKSEASGPRHRR